MDIYYLIARSRKDNSFTVLKLNEAWYKGRESGHDDVLTQANTLEAIDLVTSKFASESSMAERLATNGYIPDSNVDIFIASKNVVDGKSGIRFDEPIYNNGKNNRVAALQRFALASMSEDFRMMQADLNIILDDLIQTAYICDDYLMMLIDGSMNVPVSFAQKLSQIQRCTDVPYDLKDAEEFRTEDYLTIRSVVESLNRLEGLSYVRGDRYVANDDFVDKNINGRKAILEQLSGVLDDEYIEGQLSLFTILEDNKREEDVNKDKKIISGKIQIDRGLSDYEKRKEIFRVLRRLPRNTFYNDRASGEFKINYDIFNYYLPTEDEARKLNTYLYGKTKSGNLPKYFFDYIIDYATLQNAQDDGFTPLSEICELQTETERDVQRIDSRFKSTRCLNMAYEWAMLMDGAIKRDKEVGEGAIVLSSDAMETGKTYEKK